MKKITKIFVLAIASMVALVSCVKNEVNDPTTVGTVLKAYFDETLTKTALNDDYQVVWSSDDAISAFDIEGSQYTSTSTTVSQDGLVAEFSFNVEKEFYYAIFPADSKATMSNECVITTTLPLVQNAVAGGFDSKANLAISQNVDNTAKFLNGGTLIGFEIKNDNIKKIEFESNLNLAGPCYISIDNDNEPLLQSTYAESINKVTLQGNFEKGKTYYAVVFPTNYSGLKITFTREDGKTAEYSNSASLELDGYRNAAMTVFAKEIPDSKWQGGSNVHDILTSSDFTATSTTYSDFSGVRKHTAVYAGNSSLNNGISLRSNNSNSGVVSTTSGGKIKSVSVKWYSGTVTDRTIDVYGSNTAYTAASNLYSSSTQGTKIGSIVMGTSTSVAVTSDYAYVGIRSNSGALSLEEIDFEWADGGTPPATNYTITVADGIVGGTVTASAAEAVAGTEITLTATPADKYVFDSWNVTNASTSEAITVTDNKFTMPAANVNVSAIFKEQGGSGDETSFIFNTDAGLTALGITKPATSQGTNLGTAAYVSDAIEMTATDGGTATRVWNSGGNTTLRVYNNGGSLTFSGATITKIAFAGTVPMTANVGTFSSTTKEWTGSASSVTFTATGGVTITTITVTYTGVGPAKYLVDCATVTGGTLSATPTKAPEGTIVELTATPAAEYTFNNDWTVKGADETPITVTDGKFTMPAQNVTVSGSFTQKTYAITKTPATNGTYTVKVSDVEVETAVKGAKVTLAAEPAELYKFDGFTVKETVSGNVVTVLNNTFTMPAAAVTVSAAFSEKPVGPTYEGSGTEEDPYTINDAYMLIDGLGTETSDLVCVTGKIYQIDSYSAQYKSITYWIGSSEKPLEVYSGKNLNNTDFASKDDLNIGDEVVIKGNLKKYNSTYEFDKNNYIVSIKKAPYLKATASKTSGIAAAGETVTVTVNTNVEGWTANSDNAAFTISGKTATSFNVVVSANTTTSERTAKITVSATGVNPVEITLKQDKSGGKTKDNTAKYTLNPSQGSNNSYTGNCDVTVGNITWNVSGNSQQIPWRLGGKSISNVDRTVYSKTAYSKELWKVSLTVGSASSITVNSLKLVYSTNANFSDSKEISGTFKASSTIDFEAEFPANCYYKFVFNVTVSGSSNKFVEFSKVEFFGYQGE